MNLNIATTEDIRSLHERFDQLDSLLRGKVNPPTGGWVRSKDAKRILQCSDSSLKNYRDQGLLISKKVGGIYLYNLDSFVRKS
jgi:hypothetical protein